MTEDEYKVYLMPFPGDVRAAVRVDEEGYPSIYINDKLSPAAKKRAFLHELRHLKHSDHYNDKPIEEVEANASV